MPIDLQDLARRGAASRIAELEQEIAEIRAAFPETTPRAKKRAGAARGSAPGTDGGGISSEDGSGGQPAWGGEKKRTMSPEARARISDAQKARWAKQKRAVRS